jgi:hypothetical protein
MDLALLWPFATVPDGKIGVERTGRSDTVVQQGERGVQPRLLPAKRYVALRRTIDIHNLVVIPDDCLGVVTSHIGVPSELLTAPYDTRFGCFTDVEAFLTAGGRQGVQGAVLPPGTYAVHPHAFEVIVLDSGAKTYTVFGRQSPATDAMAKAEPNAVATPHGIAVAVYPDSDDSHVTLAMRQAGAVDRSIYEVVRFLSSAAGNVTVEWEAAIAGSSLLAQERLFLPVTDMTRRVFSTSAHWSIAEFVANIRLLEAEVAARYPARITEAVMLPQVAVPVA